MSVSRITKWLREYGEAHHGGAAFTFEVKDDPWMPFSAELQDWSQTTEAHEVLMIGYHFLQNGDICYDPQLRIELRQREIHHVSFLNWIAGAHDATGDPYVKEFTRLVWKRHFQNRPEAAAFTHNQDTNQKTQERN